MIQELMFLLVAIFFAFWSFVFMYLWINANKELERYKRMYQYRLDKYIDLMLNTKQKECK